MKIRIARPAGLTNLAKRIQSIRGNDALRRKEIRRLKEHVLNQYIKEGFRMNGELMDIQELGTYIGEDERYVLKRLQKYTDMIEGKEAQGMGKVIKAICFSGALASRSLVMAQARYLLGSQEVEYKGRGLEGKSGYVPFLTSEVNRSLSNLIASDGTLLNLLKILTPTIAKGPVVQITNQNQQANMEGPEAYLNTSQAIKMIDAGREAPLLEDEGLQNRLLGAHIDSAVPEVIATQQRGFNLKNDGGLPTKVKKGTPHELRRELDGEIINPEIMA